MAFHVVGGNPWIFIKSFVKYIYIYAALKLSPLNADHPSHFSQKLGDWKLEKSVNL